MLRENRRQQEMVKGDDIEARLVNFAARLEGRQ
jgi:hypothetical protein